MSEPTTEPTTEPSQPVTPVTPEATATPSTAVNETAKEDGRDYAAEIKKLREESAKWRTQFRDAEKQVKALSPAAQKLAELEEAQKSEEQKLKERLAQMEKTTAEAKQAAEIASKQLKLATLAQKAAVPPELVPLLDLSKLDFEDEDATIETLKKFAVKTPSANGGGASNPANPDNTQPTEKQLIDQYFRRAGRGVSIFGS